MGPRFLRLFLLALLAMLAGSAFALDAPRGGDHWRPNDIAWQEPLRDGTRYIADMYAVIRLYDDDKSHYLEFTPPANLAANGTFDPLVASGLADFTLGAGYDLIFTAGDGRILLNHTVTNASSQGIDITPVFAGGAADALAYTLIDIAAFSPTNSAGTDTVKGVNIGALTDPGATITSYGIDLGAGWDAGFRSASPIVLTHSVSNASAIGIATTPAFAGGATDLLTYTLFDVAAFSPTNSAGTDTVKAVNIGNLTDPGATITSTAVDVGTGWDTGARFASPIVTTAAAPATLGGVVTVTTTDGTTGATAMRVGPNVLEGMEIRTLDKTVSASGVETAIVSIPANSVIYSVLGNVQTLLVAGGTSVTWSLGLAATPAKYGTSGYPSAANSLLKNSKSSWIGTPTLTASAEAIVLTAAADGGAADGDTGFSAGSIRVVVVYATVNGLEDNP